MTSVNVPSRLFLYRRLVGACACRPVRFEARAVDQEDVQPAVVVVVEERRAAAGGLEQVLVLAFAAENRLRAQAGLARDVDELNTQGEAGDQLIERENA